MENKRISITVSGKVQRVGFRYFTIDVAKKNSVFGWVRNRRNGTVEILAEGMEDNLSKFIAIVKIGPASGKVINLSTLELPYTGEFSKFKSRFTK